MNNNSQEVKNQPTQQNNQAPDQAPALAASEHPPESRAQFLWRYFKIVLVFVIFVPIALGVYSIATLFITQEAVMPLYFTSYYVAKVPEGSSSHLVFNEYLEDRGYAFSHTQGEQYIYTHKDDETQTFIFSDTQILTVFTYTPNPDESSSSTS